MTPHYYPHDLATSLQLRWPTQAPSLPDLDVLTLFISTLYQASLLAEEGRPVECHVVLATQAHLEAQPVTLADFHLLRFAEARPYSEQELRRLSPAVQQPTSLLAVAPTTTGALQLWGMLFSEHEWDRSAASPRPAAAAPRWRCWCRSTGQAASYSTTARFGCSRCSAGASTAMAF